MTKKSEDFFKDPVKHGASADGGHAANLAQGDISTGGHDVEGRGPGGAFNIIGQPRRRVDGRAKVTGGTQFADDLSLPRMAWCRLRHLTPDGLQPTPLQQGDEMGNFDVFGKTLWVGVVFLLLIYMSACLYVCRLHRQWGQRNVQSALNSNSSNHCENSKSK